MRKFILAVFASLALAGSVVAQDVSDAPGGDLRVLDKLTGVVTDMSLRAGETGRLGYLRVTLRACRYPSANPSGDAYAELEVYYQANPDPTFAGWMLASAPALHAMDHPRYDVWVLRCMIS